MSQMLVYFNIQRHLALAVMGLNQFCVNTIGKGLKVTYIHCSLLLCKKSCTPGLIKIN